MTVPGEDAQQTVVPDAMALNPPCEKCGGENTRSCESIFKAANESSTGILPASIAKKCAPPPNRGDGTISVKPYFGLAKR
jgi:hypothetical protein